MKRAIYVVLAAALIISACRQELPPTIRAEEIQETAVSLANTMVVETIEAMVVETREAILTDMPAPTILPVASATPFYIPSSTPVSGSSGLPEFNPWPPPQPSARSALSLGQLQEQVGNGLKFRQVNSWLLEALNAAGYTDTSYYKVPGGFALVTRIEKIDSKGKPDVHDRWIAEINPVSFTNFSLYNYFSQLFKAPEGHYRIFVFIVTSDTLTSSATSVSQDVAENWYSKGATELPRLVENEDYTIDHKCAVYIYEFNQVGYEKEANLSIPSKIRAIDHLQQAGIWNNLTR